MIPFFTGNFQLSERKLINGNDKKGKGKRCSSDTRCLQASLLKNRQSFFLLAEEAWEIVGTCNCSAFRKLRLAHRAEIGISVKKDYLGKSIGRQLLMETIAKMCQANIKLLSLEVGSDNSWAIHLYESLGFRYIGTFKDFMAIDGQAIEFIIMILEWSKND